MAGFACSGANRAQQPVVTGERGGQQPPEQDRRGDRDRAPLLDQLARAGAADPEQAADQFQLIYDGAVANSKFSRSTEPIDRGRRMAARLLAEATS